MTTTTTATTLEVDDIAKSFGGTRAVDGVSLMAGRGNWRSTLSGLSARSSSSS